jgi:phosphosulfolactate synthase
MSELAWSGVIDHVWNGDIDRSRRKGVTMMLDTGLGLATTADLIETAGPYIDHWKFGFGTSALLTTDLLKRKLALLAANGILAFPGGTLLEAAIVQHHCRVYMNRARELGFRAVEISDGTIALPAARRRNVIECAVKAGLLPITEVGKKDKRSQPTAAALADEALQDLAWGARWVVVEARESGKGIGIYDDRGDVRSDVLEEIASRMGGKVDRLVWEAPLKSQQAALISRFGPGVSLGNVAVDAVLALQALRIGLRFETLQVIADERRRRELWKPERIEPPVPLVVEPCPVPTSSA